MSQAKIKVLFFAEGATLAHAVRPFALARGLSADRFEITFCRPPIYKWLTTDAKFSICDLPVQAPSIFARRLKLGLPLFDFPTLRAYVEQDIDLIDRVKPDAIVGDFRLSLSVSARLRSIPYITICDAYWSPEAPLKPPLPVLAFTPYIPVQIAEFLFRCISSPALRLHARPLERLRAHYNLPPLGYDLRRCYTDADLRLFANFALLFPEIHPGPDSDFINPITWFPEVNTEKLDIDKNAPLIYITMGSSGNQKVLETIVPVLENIGAQIVITTAGNRLPIRTGSTTRVFDFLPGDAICKKAQLVICNGGSPTTNQALVNGVPVLGITQNMDQFLNMRTIQNFGAGLALRADRVDLENTRSTVKRSPAAAFVH